MAAGTSRDGRAAGALRRITAIAALVAVVVILTSTSAIRTWWAYRLHDVTGGNEAADIVIGLVVGLLPVFGVVLGATRRGADSRRPRRAWRMLTFGAAGFMLTYLLAPSPARYLVDRGSARVFEVQAPGYLTGVVIAAALWLLALVVAAYRVRTWWRRLTRRGRSSPDEPRPRIIDI